MSKEGDEIRMMVDFKTYLQGQEPEAVALAVAPVLTDWEVCITRDKAGDRCMILAGNIGRHLTLPDGTAIETDPVIWIDRAFAWVRTRERLYRLGERRQR